MTLWKWSRTSSSNASADASINWAEGQPPSSVNDSARAMMAAAAKYRDDIAGAIVTGGTSTAYTVSSYQIFDSTAHLNGQMIAFTPHATNGATVTLNVDSTGAKPLRSAPGSELPSGALIQGTPYAATYNDSDGVYYLQGGAANSYTIPLGGMIPYIGLSATPNSAFAFPYGQAISRSTYAALFSLIGVQFGAGDGSTTFNLPDMRGRVVAGLDNMGGSSANRLNNVMGPNSTTVGAVGGAQQVTLGTSNLPPYTPSGSVIVGTPGFTNPQAYFGNAAVGAGMAVLLGNNTNASGATSVASFAGGFNTAPSGTFSGSAQGGSSTPFSSIPPTLLTNYIVRII